MTIGRMSRLPRGHRSGIYLMADLTNLLSRGGLLLWSEFDALLKRKHAAQDLYGRLTVFLDFRAERFYFPRYGRLYANARRRSPEFGDLFNPSGAR